MNVEWIKCDNSSVWCQLDTVDLDHEHFDGLEGVYVIWHGKSEQEGSAWVRVGQGIIRDRLAAHRKDPEIQAYRYLGLWVTWAQVPSLHRDGVEAYLAQQLNPKVGERFPDVEPIPVNLPE